MLTLTEQCLAMCALPKTHLIYFIPRYFTLLKFTEIGFSTEFLTVIILAECKYFTCNFNMFLS